MTFLGLLGWLATVVGFFTFLFAASSLGERSVWWDALDRILFGVCVVLVLVLATLAIWQPLYWAGVTVG